MKPLKDILYKAGILMSSVPPIPRSWMSVSIRGKARERIVFVQAERRQTGMAFISSVVEQAQPPSFVKHFRAACRRRNLRAGRTVPGLGQIAANFFFGNPSEKLKLVCVTGTNGKTTTVTLLFQLFRRLAMVSACCRLSATRSTTRLFLQPIRLPDPIQLNALLSAMVDEGCTHAFMEVSSHAVAQKRIAGLWVSRAGLHQYHARPSLIIIRRLKSTPKPRKASSISFHPMHLRVNADDRNGSVMLQNTRTEIHLRAAYDGRLQGAAGGESVFRTVP